jgi:adenine phosphoribosyltransferase
MSDLDALRAAIRDVPDFPKPGIVFKDITPVLGDGGLLHLVVEAIAGRWRQRRPDAVAGIDARGFIIGGAVAYELGVGFIPIRKRGKLPWQTVSVEYELEYGTSAVEMHADAVQPGQEILLVDDLLATGGTAAAGARLIGQCGGTVVGIEFLVELCFLNGRQGLQQYAVNSLVEYK